MAKPSSSKKPASKVSSKAPARTRAKPATSTRRPHEGPARARVVAGARGASAPKVASPTPTSASASASASTSAPLDVVSAAPSDASPPSALDGAGTESSAGDARAAQRPSRSPQPITGTAAMKNLAQRNAAALRATTDVSELSSEAQRIIAAGDLAAIAALGDALASEHAITHTSKVVDEILAAKPELLVSLIERFTTLVASPHKRVVQTVAAALPVMARVAPARIARHLQALTERFIECGDVGKDGLVSTFAALCMASVAYQKRLEPVLELALASADPRSLHRWSEIILPSLKGEPHARARAVVEGRLPEMPRPLAQPIANFLGIKLRPIAP